MWELCWALGLSVCWLGELCFALGLSVCWLGELCLALGLSVFCGNYVGHWVCLLIVGLMLGIGFVCWLGDLCLVMVGLFGTSTAD